MTYWNAFVANLEMHGIGDFTDERLANAKQFPVAARAGFAHIRHPVDLISPALPALNYYELALRAPKPPKRGFQSFQLGTLSSGANVRCPSHGLTVGAPAK